MSGDLHKILQNSTVRERKEFLDNLEKATSSRSISEACGQEKVQLKDDLKISVPRHSIKFITEEDKREAEIELSYINAAIALAQGSNDIGAEIRIGPFTIGVSLNNRLIPLLIAEAEEIQKYLKGEHNNYE